MRAGALANRLRRTGETPILQTQIFSAGFFWKCPLLLLVRRKGLNGEGIKDRAFSLNLLWDQMLKDNRLFGLRYPGRWCDVGHPGGIVLAEKMLRDADV